VGCDEVYSKLARTAMDIDLKLEDGKYRVAYDLKNGVAQAFRHGEPWRDLIGDNLVHALASDLSEAQKRERELTAEIASLREKLAATKVPGHADELSADDVGQVNTEIMAVAKACLETELSRLKLLPPASPAASYCQKRVHLLQREIGFSNDALIDRGFRPGWSLDTTLYTVLRTCQTALRARDTSGQGSPAAAAEYSNDLAERLDAVIYRARKMIQQSSNKSFGVVVEFESRAACLERAGAVVEAFGSIQWANVGVPNDGSPVSHELLKFEVLGHVQPGKRLCVRLQQSHESQATDLFKGPAKAQLTRLAQKMSIKTPVLITKPGGFGDAEEVHQEFLMQREEARENTQEGVDAPSA
jgi:hypothetical protein